MISGWYYNRKNGRRLLSIEEIAGACGCDSHEVKDWFAGKIGKRRRPDEILIDAGDVVTFLVRNSMPVAASLLPPRTRKILFIAADDAQFGIHSDRIDFIYRYFTSRGSVLVENSIAGKFADLTILTFSPDVVVIFLKVFDQASKSTLDLLSGFPEVTTILFLSGPLHTAMEEKNLLDRIDLLVDEALLPKQLESLMHSLFQN